MRGRLPLLVLLGGSLTFLASLFMPWRETGTTPFGGRSVTGLLTLFQGEEDRGLESARIPEEIWRIDRLPGES
jgi:hypothetical protein